MVTLQILVLSFLVRIQVAQLKTIFARRSFFFVFYDVARDVRAAHIAVLGECHDASISTHPALHGTSPTLATSSHLVNCCATWFSLLFG